MQWTHEVPIEPGWYWYGKPMMSNIIPRYWLVYILLNDGRLMVLDRENENLMNFDWFVERNRSDVGEGEWYGPLIPPE